MKHLIAAASLLALTACATGPSAYGPTKARNDVGFENTKIEKDRFRVTYTARNPDEARDYALLRAAQITTNEGYSHFKVIAGDQYSKDGGRSPISTTLGVGTRLGGRNSPVAIGVGVNDLIKGSREGKVTSSIEIKLLNVGGSDPSIYNAKDIQANIQPRVFK